MSNKQRQKVDVNKTDNVNELGQVTNKELRSDSEKYDMDNYNPLEEIDEKEVLIPKNKTEVVTIRLSPQENNIISNLANENGLSKSAFIRMVVKKALKHSQ